jgi:hypothetical protein
LGKSISYVLAMPNAAAAARWHILDCSVENAHVGWIMGPD